MTAVSTRPGPNGRAARPSLGDQLDRLDDVVQIDANSAARMLCGRCRRKGLTFQAWHRGRQYAATATCPACHAVEQV